MQVIDTFDPKRTTVDSYVDDAPMMKDKRIGEVEHKFIHQVFYGCVRYQKFLKLFVTSFLYKCPTTALRSEQTLYTVLAYILFFRLEEITVPEFRRFLLCGSGTESALLALLRYALCVEDLEKWVKMEWIKLYDVTYIEDEIIGKLQSFEAELRPVVEEVELKATGTIAAKDGTMVLAKQKRMTSPKPFNITQPRPRLIPEPEVINREVKALPVPANLHATSLAEVEEEKRQRREAEREKTKKKHLAAPVFDITRTDNSKDREELARQIEAQRMAECTFQPQGIKPYKAPAEEAVVKLNAAAVLREDALLKKKQAKEYDILKRYEQDLRDASEFSDWQQQMKEKDHLEEEMRVHQRMVESQLAREEAVEAYESMVRRKRIMAEHQKEETKTLMAIQEHESRIDMENKQKLVVETIEERKKVQEAEEEAIKAKHEIAKQMRQEKDAEFERKKREDEQEMAKRKDLIMQIRALEKVPVERFKAFDPAEAPCQGFLEEMSLAELRERLSFVTAQRAKETEDKRERQMEKKLERQQELADKAETLAKIRERAKSEAQQRHALIQQKENEVKERKDKYREQCIERTADKIAMKRKQKREEELRLKKELKEKSSVLQFLQASREMNEAKAHAEQQLGLEREAKNRQAGLLLDQQRADHVKFKDTLIRDTNQQRDAEEYRAMQEAVRSRVQRAKAAHKSMTQDILMANTIARDTQKELARRSHADFGHTSNRYIEKLKQASKSV